MAATFYGSPSEASRIGDWPADLRPREQLQTRGASTLSDADLLAVVLRTGVQGRNAIELARDLLIHFGSLRQLLAADCPSFCAVRGLGPARWASLQAGTELVRRSLGQQLEQRDALSSPALVRQFLGLWLRERPQEVFAALFLDTQNRLLIADELFRGTLSQTAVYPREVARRALAVNAASVIVAHNHPSGLAQASPADRQLTDALKQALCTVGVTMLDHLIIAGSNTFSFAERGWL